MASKLDELLARVTAGVDQLSARVGKFEARHDGRITLPSDELETEADVAAANADESPIEYPEPAEGELGANELRVKKADDEMDEPSAENDAEGEAHYDAVSSAIGDVNDALERLTARLGAYESRNDNAAFEAKHPRGPDGKFGKGNAREHRVGNQRRWRGEAGDITMHGKVTRFEDRTSEADRLNNEAHERIKCGVFDKSGD